MFDTIILLAGQAEQVAMPPVLCAHNPRLTVVSVATSANLAALDPDLLERARLIAFATPEIVSKSVLATLGYGAINFHPGPPDYPGWAPAHFALYERATEFGATVHNMVERVDAGPIIEVAHFPIPADIAVLGLEGLAYAHLARLFWRMAKRLRPIRTRRPCFRSNGATENIPAAPIGRSAIFRSTSPRMNSTAA